MINIEATYIRHDYRHFPEVVTNLEIDSKKLAFLIIDMQNDFAHPEGMMAKKVGNIISAVRETIEPTKRVADACRKAGVKVIYTQHVFRPDVALVGKSWARIYVDRAGTISPSDPVGPPGKKLGSLVKGTWNAEIVEELQPQTGDIVVDNKRTYSGFYHTDLDMILRTLGIETIMFAGLTTAVCVESTLRDAFFHEYQCILLKDCAWEKTPELQAASEKLVMIHFGSVTTSVMVVKALAA